jgi:FkbM family methyltransferase
MKMPPNLNIIFDFGANEGQNISYYLSKCDVVVAVEGNPSLVALIKEKFKGEIERGRVHVENVAITDSNSAVSQFAKFYISKKSNLLSTVIAPEKIDEFDLIEIPTKTTAEIIEKYTTRDNPPLYCKFDLEMFDAIAVKSMFDQGIYPTYCSVEIHDHQAAEEVLKQNRYSSYQIVKGSEIGPKPKKKLFSKEQKNRFQFARHSAGPFGDDLGGFRLSSRLIREELDFVGSGWLDLHACQRKPDNSFKLSIWRIWINYRRLRRRLGKLVRSCLR